MDTTGNLGIRSRLLGKEDILFDTGNVDAVESFVDAFGKERLLTAVNASHVPLGGDALSETGKQDVASAIVDLSRKEKELSEKVGQIIGLAKDDIYTMAGLGSEDTAALLSYINGKIHNRLNNRTLTIKLDANGSPTDFTVSRLYGGKTVVDLNQKTISASAGAPALRLSDCDCMVEVRNGTIDQGDAPVGVEVLSTGSVSFIEVTFTANGKSEQYAVRCAGSNASFKGCSFTGTGKATFGIETEQAGKAVDALALYNVGVKAKMDMATQSFNALKSMFDKVMDYVVEEGVDEATGISWEKYLSGRLVARGHSTFPVEYYKSNVFRIEFPQGVRFSDEKYCLVVTPSHKNEGWLEFKEDGSISKFTPTETDGGYQILPQNNAGLCVVIRDLTTDSGFTVVSSRFVPPQSDASEEPPKLSFDWLAMGMKKQEATGTEETP